MNIWFAIWVFLAVFLLGISIWSLQILLRQRRAWMEFARRNNLQCILRGFTKSPVLKGAFRSYVITVFSSDQTTEDSMRGGKFRTIIQFDMKPGMPVEGVIASPGARNFALGMGIPKDVTPDLPDWNKSILIRVQDEALIKPYLTRERLQVLNGLMSIKNTNTLFIFNEDETYFRFETADALDDVTRMEKQLGKIIDAAKVIEPA